MIKVTDEERRFLIENIENAEEILMSDNVNDILDSLSDFLNFAGFDKNDDITDYGRKIERIYDNIYYNSFL